MNSCSIKLSKIQHFIPAALVAICASCSIEDHPDTIIIDHFTWEPSYLVTDSFQIDLNKDGLMDLSFNLLRYKAGTSQSGGDYYDYYANCSNLNDKVQLSLGKKINPAQEKWECLKKFQLLSDELTWNAGYTLEGVVIAAGGIGVWDRHTHEGYIGLRISADKGVFYGWIWITINEGNGPNYYEIECHEYGLSETPGSGILVGQTE